MSTTGTLQIADEVAHLALTYVDAVSRHGHSLTTGQLEWYIRRPLRRPGSGRIGQMLARQNREPSVPS